MTSAAPIDAHISQEEMRQAIETQTCPWCKRGPYKRLAAHTQTAHSVLGAELREIAGYPVGASICSPEDSEASRDHLLGLPNRDEMTKRGAEAAQAVGALQKATAAYAAKTLAANAHKHDQIVRLFRQHVLVQEIAEQVGMDRTTVINVLRRRGEISGPLLTERYQNSEYADRFRRSTKGGAVKTVAFRQAKREARIREFIALGGDEAATRIVAARWGISHRSVMRFLAQSQLKPGERP